MRDASDNVADKTSLSLDELPKTYGIPLRAALVGHIAATNDAMKASGELDAIRCTLILTTLSYVVAEFIFDTLSVGSHRAAVVNHAGDVSEMLLDLQSRGSTGPTGRLQ